MPQLGQSGFPDPALAQRSLGLVGFDLGQNNDGEGVGVLEQLSLVLD